MKVKKLQTDSSLVDAALSPIYAALQNISADNFSYFELSGTTNSTADTKQLFNHNLKGVPSLWFVLEGDIYIPRNGAGTTNIDIRSRRTSESFRVLIIN